MNNIQIIAALEAVDSQTNIGQVGYLLGQLSPEEIKLIENPRVQEVWEQIQGELDK